jgi:hypothetical protein
MTALDVGICAVFAVDLVCIALRGVIPLGTVATTSFALSGFLLANRVRCKHSTFELRFVPSLDTIQT